MQRKCHLRLASDEDSAGSPRTRKEYATMPLAPEPRNEHPSTYFVEDRENKEEITRLRAQDQLLTAGMGGILPEQPEPTRFQHILDVGCGTGGWLIAAAKTYPTMTRLVGVDVSSTMIAYARDQAAAEGVSKRVEFHIMDALRMLEFPDQTFDLINQRLGQGYLRTWEWGKLLQEYQRVCRPGGVVRITESESGWDSNSPALLRLNTFGIQASYHAGNIFAPTRDGLLKELAGLLQKAGLQEVQTHAHALRYRAGTPEGQRFAEDMAQLYRTAFPFLRKWVRLPDNYEDIYQQMLNETRQPDFVATWHLLTATGKVPPANDRLTGASPR
jgi:ubiquinone/menaquinone biosynthesis C-methylase UbiE